MNADGARDPQGEPKAETTAAAGPAGERTGEAASPADLERSVAARAGDGGAFRARAEDPADRGIVDATAWAALALAVARARGPAGGDSGTAAAATAARDALARLQAPDGRLSTHPLHPGAYAPTSVAVLAWSGDAVHRENRERALAFLLEHRGLTFDRDPASPIRVDTEVAGWPWIDRTFSWAEPTALALLALRAAGLAHHARAEDAVRLLLDRQIASGGWNYGNSEVFGSELRPAPESTGLVLAALAGLVERAAVAHSLERLAADLPRLRTPLALGWSLLAAAAWGITVADRNAAIAATLARASRFGGYETADLALLLVARDAPAGLLAALPAAGSATRSGARG